MRPLAALSLVVLVVLAGCSVPFVGGNNATSGGTSAPSSETTSGATGSATGGTGESTGSGGSATGRTNASSTAKTGSGSGNLADPAHDVLGWEGGYWYNESVPLDPSNGFNASERRALVNQTMARDEHIRHLEFTSTVPVDVISRAEYRNRTASGGGNRGPAFKTFDNAKFEGLFLVGENQNSLAVQRRNRGSNVLGYYSPANNSIVIVSPNETPTIDPSTLSHELTHALQDQHFNLSSSDPPTRDAYNARNGLVEGDANYVEQRYDNACGSEWQCVQVPSSGGGGSGSDLDLGVYILSYFPYADGPGFVSYLRSHGGWSRVNAAYDDLPRSTEQVIHPAKYDHDQPTNVTVKNTNSNGWTRVRPKGRPDYAVLGQSALSAMFGATLYDDYNRSSVVAPRELLNVENGNVNATDPFNYGLNYTDGWDGDRMAVYRKQNSTGYVWKLAWDSPADAREFVRGYHELLAEWGGEPVSGPQGVWKIRRDSPYTDAFRITQHGTTVTIVNAPRTRDLGDVHR